MKTVVILGSGRSGTSLVANMLIKLGVHMGDDLLGPGPHNPMGHFENMCFLDLNDKVLLPAAGGSWHSPPSREGIEKAGKLFGNKIRTLVEREQREPIWGWKDPRTSLLIDLYYPYLENPFFIVCQRSNEEIAQSWHKGSNIPLDNALRLSKIYHKKTMDFVEGNECKHFNIDFDYALNKPGSLIEDLSKFLGINPSVQQKRSARFCVIPKGILKDMGKYIAECDAK